MGQLTNLEVLDISDCVDLQDIPKSLEKFQSITIGWDDAKVVS
jgi:hypothetical protein